MDNIIEYMTRGKSSIFLPLILLILSCIIFECTDLDLYIQDYFYDTKNHIWFFDFKNKESVTVFIYHKFPKLLLILFAVSLLTKIILAIKKRSESSERIRKMLYIFVVLAIILGSIAFLKTTNNMPYPYKIDRYGGTEQKRSLIEAFTNKTLESGRFYKGWPGGHSTTGFALLGLGFVFYDKRKRLKGFLFATFCGFLLGMCHTVDGNHFFSHNVASWLIGWFLAAITYKLFFPTKKIDSTE